MKIPPLARWTPVFVLLGLASLMALESWWSQVRETRIVS